jgi:hypothetical protein
LSEAIKGPLQEVFRQGDAQRVQDLHAGMLKVLTGLPPAKAVRALCVFFDLVESPGARWPVSSLSSDAIERFVRQTANPFDLLREADVASVIELGSGDLSFASELVDLYLPVVRQRNHELTLHCLDRLDPGSKLGGPLHPEQDRIQHLRAKLGPLFRFYGNQDMFDLRELDDRGQLAPRYTIATCWAPATPTFAYEPTRLSASVIGEDLRRTKGAFHPTRFAGEPALEVQEGGRTMLFPPWKFDIRGPLALLGLLAHRGLLCVLGAVDSQVFWELLSQLLEAPRYRPHEQPFTPTNLPEIFGEIHRRLDGLPVGAALDLADLGALRTQFPPFESTSSAGRSSSSFSFRHVSIRRGATFLGMPASSTARKFSSMREEAPPWLVTLVPSRP